MLTTEIKEQTVKVAIDSSPHIFVFGSAIPTKQDNPRKIPRKKFVNIGIDNESASGGYNPASKFAFNTFVSTS